jgi:hypothetical protein
MLTFNPPLDIASILGTKGSKTPNPVYQAHPIRKHQGSDITEGAVSISEIIDGWGFKTCLRTVSSSRFKTQRLSA